MPFGKIIADDIRKEDKKSLKIIYDCCWGEWGQPEPKTISNLLGKKEFNFRYIDKYETCLDCDFFNSLKENKVIIYTSPDDIETFDKLNSCLRKTEIILMKKDNKEIKVVKKAILFKDQTN